MKNKVPSFRFLFPAFLLAVLGARPAKAEIAFSGELRLRPEYFDNADFNKATKDTRSFVGSRLRITGSGLAAEDIAVKFTFQDTRNWGEEAGTAVGLTDTGEAVDLHEGFVDFQNFMKLPVSLRAGRQELIYGDQRLVGAFGWNNQGRAFDAFKLAYAGQNLSVDAWTAKRKDTNATTAGRASTDRDFSGIYAVLKPALFLGSLDLYLLNDHEGDTTTTPNAKAKSVTTAGVRMAGRNGPIDYTLEAPFQFGENGTVVGASSTPVKVSANAFALKAGYNFAGSKELRLGLEYDYASGDDNASDDKSKTFQNLYPTNHPFYGYMDYQGWRNMSAINFVANLKPTRRTFVLAQYWDFSLAEEKDAWYNAAGAAPGFRAVSAANTEKKIGSEIDLLFRFMQSRQVIWEAGYSRFLTGSYIEARVAAEGPSDWAYLMATVKF